MGAPKATATPAAEEADRISLKFFSFLLYFGNILQSILHTQHPICTKGPSLPNESPLDTERI